MNNMFAIYEVLDSEYFDIDIKLHSICIDTDSAFDNIRIIFDNFIKKHNLDITIEDLKCKKIDETGDTVFEYKMKDITYHIWMKTYIPNSEINFADEITEEIFNQ